MTSVFKPQEKVISVCLSARYIYNNVRPKNIKAITASDGIDSAVNVKRNLYFDTQTNIQLANSITASGL